MVPLPEDAGQPIFHRYPLWNPFSLICWDFSARCQVKLVVTYLLFTQEVTSLKFFFSMFSYVHTHIDHFFWLWKMKSGSCSIKGKLKISPLFVLIIFFLIYFEHKMLVYQFMERLIKFPLYNIQA